MVAANLQGLLGFLMKEENLLPLLNLSAGLISGSRPGSSFADGALTGLKGYMTARLYQDERKANALLRQKAESDFQKLALLSALVGRQGETFTPTPLVPDVPQPDNFRSILDQETAPARFSVAPEIAQSRPPVIPVALTAPINSPGTGMFAPKNAANPLYLPMGLIAAGEPALGVGLLEKMLGADGKKRDFRIESKLYRDNDKGRIFFYKQDGKGLPVAIDQQTLEPYAPSNNISELNQGDIGDRAVANRVVSEGRFNTRNFLDLSDRYAKETELPTQIIDQTNMLDDLVNAGNQSGIKSVMQTGYLAALLPENSLAIAKYNMVRNPGDLLARLRNAVNMFVSGARIEQSKAEILDLTAQLRAGAERVDNERYDYWNRLAVEDTGRNLQRRRRSSRGAAPPFYGDSGAGRRPPVDVRGYK